MRYTCSEPPLSETERKIHFANYYVAVGQVVWITLQPILHTAANTHTYRQILILLLVRLL